MAIEITTFGDFDIRIYGQSVLKKSKRTNKNLELLKYFITYRRKKLLPEMIIDDLWPDADFADPKNVLRTQIFRLRKNIEDLPFNDSEKMCSMDVVFENGFYIFNPRNCCIIDTDRFEEGIKKADLIRDKDSDKAIEIYREVINLYRGEYLSENPYSEWIFTIRSRFHRLFVQSVLRLFELLKNKRRFEEIVAIYDQIIALEPFEESIHIYFLESLSELKDYKNALSYYNYIVNRMYREMSINPTPALKRIYKKIISFGEENQETDLIQVVKKLVDDDKIEGAFFCDMDCFKTIYNLECRRSSRTNNTKFLGLITIVRKVEPISDVEREEARDVLINIMIHSLRKCDVFCCWNSYQVIVLLTNILEVNLPIISTRIEKKFKTEINPNKFFVRICFQPVTADEYCV